MQTYDPQYWFEDVPVLAKLSADRAAAKLRELGDIETADSIEWGSEVDTGIYGAWEKPRRVKPWQHTAEAFGYTPLIEPGDSEMVEILHAGNMEADTSLKNARIRVTLDQLRVADYPGKGIHTTSYSISTPRTNLRATLSICTSTRHTEPRKENW